MKEILSMDATTLAQKIRAGEISSQEATETYIRHIQQVNPHINAMVEDRFEQARHEARERDRELMEGTAKGKLFGVPVSIKESFYMVGMKTTSGLSSRKNDGDPKDADVVRLLKNEGAVILGKTNTPIFLLCQETDNYVYGRTNNPWNLERTAGGSSGGEGAFIAVGGAAVGLGSDIGGSIRFPSHFNGIIGFKSGKQQVSDEGHFPPFSPPFQRDMQGIVPMAKSVQDAELVYEIIAKHPLKKQELDQVEFVIPRIDPKYPLDSCTLSLYGQVEQYLSKHVKISKQSPPYFDQAVQLWAAVMTSDGGEQFMPSLEKENFDHLHPYFKTILGVAQAIKPSPEQWEQVTALRTQAESEVLDYFKQRVLVLPVYHTPAPEHGRVVDELFSEPENLSKFSSFISYVNCFGLPALVIPVGENEEGMPISIQLTTATGQEDALFQAGKIIEKEFRGYVRCTYWD
ncbi:amidase [Paenactinomyces guangxiensis]|uniref:Amidase n=1 Tax=Paenactinomyces guangxiensis TaxID=1490290 RepID=A0A7W1WSU4_9BACL|nr:amidase [Paenactinomyces guangxiensis]MBA4495329.1 amidase [Paenactinomyces guangxiensis]MBH8592550.1 amidase [Paenactinomyces guangxiensis]